MDDFIEGKPKYKSSLLNLLYMCFGEHVPLVLTIITCVFLVCLIVGFFVGLIILIHFVGLGLDIIDVLVMNKVSPCHCS